MRTKDQIMREVKSGGMEVGSTSLRDNVALLVEVMLDIRDLLIEKEINEMTPKESICKT